MASITGEITDEIVINGLNGNVEVFEEEVLWNGRKVTILKGPYDPTLPNVILCSKKKREERPF